MATLLTFGTSSYKEASQLATLDDHLAIRINTNETTPSPGVETLAFLSIQLDYKIAIRINLHRTAPHSKEGSHTPSLNQSNHKLQRTQTNITLPQKMMP